MIPGVFRLLAVWLGLALLLAAPRPALAAGFAPGSACHAAAAAGEDYAALAARPGRWTCSGSGWSVAAPRAFLRLDLRGTDTAAEMLTTRLTRFRAARLTVIAADGTSASRDLTEADMIPATGDWLMRTPLPQVAGERVAVVLRVDEARHAGMLSDARLEDGADTPASLRHELAVAMLCGTLLLPLLFNLAFYRILRERFLLWHMLSTAFMLAHTLITSGLVNRFAALSLEQLSVASAASVGGGIVCASLFSADLVEPGKLDAIHRRLLRCVALWVPLWTLFYLYADGPPRALSAPLYLASFLPLMVLFAWAMTVARRRGSRAVNFQIAAWMPVMITALVRIASSLGATDAPLEMLLEQHVAMGLEVIITSLGVIDRLLVIRRQRDVARAEARVLEERAERDFLTGLLNRRFVELRFDDMRAGGFHAMALLDLDRFKQINDTFGHVTGDAVLRAAAEALEPDGDTLAIRLGGEEFLLLMRGGDVPARAERRRQAIAARVAARVPGLDRIVTASMGLVEQPGDDSADTGFAALYARCDQLLYEAKGAGRNQMMREGPVPAGPQPARSAPHAA
jgi:diguanylate cyclase (GGDEF)-like protein